MLSMHGMFLIEIVLGAALMILAAPMANADMSSPKADRSKTPTQPGETDITSAWVPLAISQSAIRSCRSQEDKK